jgi:hypothetical protein
MGLNLCGVTWRYFKSLTCSFPLNRLIYEVITYRMIDFTLLSLLFGLRGNIQHECRTTAGIFSFKLVMNINLSLK